MSTLPQNHVYPADRPTWRAWLAEHHARAQGVWLVINKADAPTTTLSTDDVVEEAIAFGWIDSLPRKLDDTRWMLYVAPRKPGSNWSRLSKARAERMRAAGRLAPSGEAAIDRARNDGSWEALDDVERLIVPDDLAAALADRPPARARWDGFPPSTRRGILEWISNAKRAATRAKRLDETARLAQVGKRANQWPRES